jgi:hypothetical protein
VHQYRLRDVPGVALFGRATRRYFCQQSEPSDWLDFLGGGVDVGKCRTQEDLYEEYQFFQKF